MSTHVCPWWAGYFLVNPIRKLFQDPVKILSPYIKESMKVIDIGSGMGYFTLPIANMIGDNGKVISVDIQKQMLNVLKKKAHNLNFLSRIELTLCENNSLCIDKWNDKIDFVLAFYVVHEIPDRRNFFFQIYKVLKNEDGLFLFAEPRGHVSIENFNDSIRISEDIGFKRIRTIDIKRSHAVLLSKKM